MFPLDPCLVGGTRPFCLPWCLFVDAVLQFLFASALNLEKTIQASQWPSSVLFILGSWSCIAPLSLIFEHRVDVRTPSVGQILNILRSFKGHFSEPEETYMGIHTRTAWSHNSWGGRNQRHGEGPQNSWKYTKTKFEWKRRHWYRCNNCQKVVTHFRMS